MWAGRGLSLEILKAYSLRSTRLYSNVVKSRFSGCKVRRIKAQGIEPETGIEELGSLEVEYVQLAPGRWC